MANLSAGRRVRSAVKHDSWWWGERFVGKREALIASGIAERSWFPQSDVPSVKRAGAVKRKFTLTVGGLKVVLQNYAPASDGWEVRKYVSKEEERRRRAEAEAEFERAKQSSSQRNEERVRELMARLEQEEEERAAKRERGEGNAPASPEIRKIAALSVTELKPIIARLTGCGGLLGHIESTLSSKLAAIQSAHEYQNKYMDAEALEERREERAELQHSSKIGRAIDDLEILRASLGTIVADLKRVSNNDA